MMNSPEQIGRALDMGAEALTKLYDYDRGQAHLIAALREAEWATYEILRLTRIGDDGTDEAGRELDAAEAAHTYVAAILAEQEAQQGTPQEAQQ